VVTTYYLDTSIAYHALVSTPSAAEWFDRTDNEDPGSPVSSRLLRTELTRALRRDGTPVQDRDAVLDKVAQVPLTESVLVGAEAITEHVKTLDAIHLASALALGTDVVVVSHVDGIKRVAALLGLGVLDPLMGDTQPS
jgi:predicted nucleic acid-binding protein